MELQKLQAFVVMIVLVGMVIGIGVMITDKFGSATYYDVADYNDTTAITGNNTRIALDKGNLTGVDRVWNGTTNVLDSSCYQVFTENGSIAYLNYTAICDTRSSVQVIYDYRDYDTATSNVMSSVSSEVAGLATNWLGLLVTVAIMALILGLVISSFGGKYNR